MQWQIAKVVIAAVVISFSSWLAGKQPRLAGFILALPISSLIALVLFYTDYRDPSQAAAFARSIFWAVPLSLLFFVPFLFAEHLKWGFWALYASGLFLLACGYFIQRAISAS